MRVIGKIVPFAGLLIWSLFSVKEVYCQTDNAISSFEIQLNGAGAVNIQWGTSGREKKARFEIERSSEKRIWANIAIVTGEWNNSYCFIDSHPMTGLNYYRIKQVDDNAQAFWSPVKEIAVTRSGELYVWPNPVNDVLHIRAPIINGTIDIIDAQGRILQKAPVAAFTTDIPVTRLTNGIYFVRIRYDNRASAHNKRITIPSKI